MSDRSRKAGGDYHKDKNTSRKVNQLLSDVGVTQKTAKPQAHNSSWQWSAKEPAHKHVDTVAHVLHTNIQARNPSLSSQSKKEFTGNGLQWAVLPARTNVRMADWLPCEWSVDRLDCRLIRSVSVWVHQAAVAAAAVAAKQRVLRKWFHDVLIAWTSSHWAGDWSSGSQFCQSARLDTNALGLR